MGDSASVLSTVSGMIPFCWCLQVLAANDTGFDKYGYRLKMNSLLAVNDMCSLYTEGL